MKTEDKCTIKGHGRLVKIEPNGVLHELDVSCEKCGEMLEVGNPEYKKTPFPNVSVTVKACTSCNSNKETLMKKIDDKNVFPPVVSKTSELLASSVEARFPFFLHLGCQNCGGSLRGKQPYPEDAPSKIAVKPCTCGFAARENWHDYKDLIYLLDSSGTLTLE